MADTQPGGIYQNEFGDLVDANGQPTKKARATATATTAEPDAPLDPSLDPVRPPVGAHEGVVAGQAPGQLDEANDFARTGTDAANTSPKETAKAVKTGAKAAK